MTRANHSSLRNELFPGQKALMYAFLAVIVIVMALPMWNVIVVSTTT